MQLASTASSSTASGTDTELCSIILVGSTKENGSATSSMEKVISYSKTAQYTRDFMLMASLREWGAFNGLMVNSTKDNGSLGTNMALGCGTAQREIAMSANGNSARLMDTGCMFG